MKKKKILIVYSETGGGHLRAAQALAEEINLRKNIEVVLYDGGRKTNWGQQINPSLIFYVISHHLLPLYNLIYRLTDNPFGVSILRAVIKSLWGTAFKKILDKEKPDLIISTHHFISPSTISNYDQNIPMIVVVSDLGRPHRIWFDKKFDYIIVPNEEMAIWAQKKFNLPDSKIKAIGFPIRKEFRNSKKEDLSNQILILGSGIKPKTIKNWIKNIKLKLPGEKIVLVCGHNLSLQKSLSNIEGVQTYGFINHIHTLLIESDLVITKAGPSTIMEAIALRKPIIAARWVGLQERGNVDFIVENNVGIYDPNGKNLVSSIEKIYKNYQKYTSPKNIISFDTEVMADYIISLVK